MSLEIELTESEIKKFEPRLKYGGFHLKLYSIYQDLGWRSIETGFWGFETLKFIKFGHSIPLKACVVC